MKAAWAVCLLLLFTPGIGRGFFPEAKELAQRVEEQFSRMQSWHAVLRLTEEAGFRIHCWRREASWRQEWVSQRNETASVVRAALGHRQRLLASYPPVFEFPLPPLRLAGRDDPLALWRSLGLDTEIKSYQFFARRPCIVLGARFGRLDRPQVWIDLEEHVPLRLVSASGLQWIWKDYYRTGNVSLPHSLTILLPGGKRLSMEMVWKGVNTDIPRSLFDVSAFEDRFGQAPASQLPSQKLQLFWERLPKSMR